MLDVPLGTLIFRAGLLGEEQLEGALQEGMRTGKRLGEVLLERGWLNERDLGRMLAGQKGLPFVDVNVSDVEPEALAALAEDDARRQVALPLFYEDGELIVAVGDPSNEVVLEGLRRELETDFQLVVAPHSQLQQVIDEAYTRPAAAPAPAPEREGVLFPDLVPPAKDEAPVEIQPVPAFESEPEPEPEAQPDLGFASAVEPELGVEPAPEIETSADPDAEEKPFSGSTPTLLSRMLFPSVRHAAQESGEQVADEPVAEEPAPADAPEPPEESARAVEDFAELEVPAIPEMPVPSFEQQAEATEPTPPAEVPEPAAEHVADQPAEQAAGQVADEPAEQVAEEPADQVAEEPTEQVAEEPAEEVAEQAANEPTEPAAEEPTEQAAEEAQPSTHSVVVRLREGESLRIGEHGTAAEASAQAADAVAQIAAAANSGTWPLFAGRYLSPDTIVSVDLLEESPDA
jgi:MshEN domain